MRNAFIDELVCLAQERDNIALIVGDLGFSVIEPFADRFPERFINAGVSEQNMSGLAAGLASEGYHVFTYSIANFPTIRCAEQIRNDIDYHNLPVTVVSVGGGLAYGTAGYSHHAVQDYSLMRTLPHMLIASPGDPMEVRSCMRYIANNPQPSYLRLGKAGEPNFHTSPPIVEPGMWIKIPQSSNIIGRSTILTTGATLGLAMEFQRSELNTLSASVHSMPLWSLNSKKHQNSQILNYDKVLTIEDHLLDGGFGSWLLESATSPQARFRIQNMALDIKVCGAVGKQETLNHFGGLNLSAIANLLID